MQILTVLAVLVAAGLFIWLRARSKSRATDPKEYRGDYGRLSMPPSPEAATILSSMTEEEKLNFRDLLGRLQEWHESIAEKGPLSFHPEARASLWGTALAKIADHYREIGRNDRALFFTSAAWNLSRYPVFAYNVAMLSIETGDVIHAKNLLETYLAEYRNVLTSSSLRLVNPEVTADELERLAKSARTKLAALQPGE